MDESCQDPGVTTYFFDTCALLAIAMMPRGPEMLRGAFATRSLTAVVVEDVDEELQDLRRASTSSEAKRRAADAALSRFSWMTRQTVDGADELNAVEMLRAELGTHKGRGRRDEAPARKRADWGECAVIFAAQRERASSAVCVVVATNDAPALRLADAKRLEIADVVDLLRMFVADGLQTAKQAFNLARTVNRHDQDVGRFGGDHTYFDPKRPRPRGELL